MSKRLMALIVFGATIGATAAYAHYDHCAWLQGWGSATNLGSAQASAKVDLSSRVEAWSGRYRRGYEWCDGPTMHCKKKGDDFMCVYRGKACLK